jgi:transketolase
MKKEYSEMQVKNLKEIAKRIRKHILLMTAEAGSGHYMSSLSTVEILVTLYFNELNHDPKNPKNTDRDRFILSKGHAAPALYAVLAETGYFPLEELKTLRKFGSHLQGHPESLLLPGIDTSSGSLGQGISVGVGMAISAKLDRKKYRVFVLLGDGECQEGQVWEAAMSAAHYKLDNLIAIIDKNNLQSTGKVEEIMSLGNLSDKWKSFGWNVLEANGHSFSSLLNSIKKTKKVFSSLLNSIKKTKKVTNKPSVIIANTVKGKGIPFMENDLEYHVRPLSEEELRNALELIS